MDSYRNISELHIKKLTALRQGLFRLWYELADGQFIYGKLTHTGWTNRSALLRTADQTWEIKRNCFFSCTPLIKLLAINNIGRVSPKNWSLVMLIIMNSGFEALLAIKKSSLKRILYRTINMEIF